MSWNRTYRPKKIADLHLASVRDHFLSLMKSGSFPQVFLFAGSKGTGKTSTARIVAAMLNDPVNEEVVKEIFFEKKTAKKPLQEPDSKGELASKIFTGTSYVVHELDAASNRGIDDVRALKERVHLPPQEGILSVYILDEVHMLTTEAFNALLKILEEPPVHVVFILATTELDKIPATVVSRAQVIRFSKAGVAEIESAVKKIVKSEKLTAEDTVLTAIAEQADGSFRDAVKLLEMISQVGPVTSETAEPILHLSLNNQVTTLITTLLAKDPVAVVKAFETIRNNQIDTKLLHSQILGYLHTDLLKSLGVSEGTAQLASKVSQYLLKELADPHLSSPTAIPLLLLELQFLHIIEKSQKKAPTGGGTESTPTSSSSATTGVTTSSKTKASAKTATGSLPEAVVIAGDPPVQAQPVQSMPLDTVPTLGGATGNGQAICDQWAEVITKATKFNFGLGTLLKSAKPLSGSTGKLSISVYYKFHKEQLLQPKFTKLLDELFVDVAGGRLQLECLLVEEPKNAELKETATNQNLAELAVSSLM